MHLQLHSLIFFHDITPVFLYFFYRLVTRLKSISQRSYTFDADILYGKNKKFLPLQSLLPSHIEVSTENCCTFSFWWCVLRYIHANYFFHFKLLSFNAITRFLVLRFYFSFDPYFFPFIFQYIPYQHVQQFNMVVQLFYSLITPLPFKYLQPPRIAAAYLYLLLFVQQK